MDVIWVTNMSKLMRTTARKTFRHSVLDTESKILNLP